MTPRRLLLLLSGLLLWGLVAAPVLTVVLTASAQTSYVKNKLNSSSRSDNRRRGGRNRGRVTDNLLKKRVKRSGGVVSVKDRNILDQKGTSNKRLSGDHRPALNRIQYDNLTPLKRVNVVAQKVHPPSATDDILDKSMGDRNRRDGYEQGGGGLGLWGEGRLPPGRTMASTGVQE
eukprot:GHVQ01004180.1.p1 GENE.GHVQ01004180.1~~GHVQ01004180.1.p1  ORF type:complete len:175 (+),score=36.85 GHVQ01004180.1:560-1084(+)